MAGKAVFRIEGDDATARAFNSVTARAKEARDKIEGFTKAAFVTTGVAEFTAKIVEAGKAAVEMGDQISKAATKAGIGGKGMSELAYAAKLADVDLSSLSTSLKKMQVAISEASTGNKDAKLAFDALGISLAQIQKLKPEDQFELIGDRISKLQDPADRARAATALFGKAGADLLPLFEQGAAGIAKARAEAEKLGASFSDDTLKRLSDFNDAGKRLSASWDAFATTLTAKVAPALTTVFDSLSGTREAQLKDQLAFLNKVKGEGFVAVNPLGSYPDIGNGVYSAAEGDKLRERLQAQLDNIETTRFNLGGRGRPAAVPGFSQADAADKAAAAAKKAADAASKASEDYHNDLFKMDQEVGKQLDDNRKKEVEGWFERKDAADAWYNEYLKREKEAQVLRDQDAQRTAQFIQGTLLQAFDDFINTGKFSFKQFLAYLAAELARSQFVKLLANIGSGSSSGGGGWLSAVGSIIGSIFSGGSSGGSIDGKASGGSVNAGQTYLVGERGMELFRPRTSGSIVPNHALGGGGVFAPVYNIDARGATTELIKILPGLLKQTSEDTENRVVSRMRRNWYGLNQ